MTDIHWDRLEPHTRAPSFEQGLQARVADPLWLLARQWQMGEFRGEDAASPVQVRCTATYSPLSSFRSEAEAGAVTEAFDGTVPLEVRVEAEAVEEGPAAFAHSAEAGLQLLRRLEQAGLPELRATFRDALPLTIAAEQLAGLPAREQRRLQLLARRSLDGRALATLSGATLDGFGLDAFTRVTVEDLIATTVAELDARFAGPGTSGGTWAEERLEYQFSLAASTDAGEVVLGATEYPGGHLDWHAFDVDAGLVSHGLGTTPASTIEINAIPVPLRYGGMPASRWWELEEGTVYFGGIEAGPADIARLCVAEYATIYGDDWFLVPVRLPVGTVARIPELEVVDVFGGVTTVRSCAELDEAALAPGEERTWSFFELSGDPSASSAASPWLLLCPALGDSLDGTPLETVTFVRDEQANLAWAVEESVEIASGHSLARRLGWGLRDRSGEPGASASSHWSYRLQQQVPPYVIPLIPERIDSASPEVMLRRARMQAWDEIPDTSVVGARGRILAPEQPLRLYEEELPRGGLRVTRGWQLTRDRDGGRRLWMSRRRRPGRGERGSGLRHDVIDRGAG